MRESTYNKIKSVIEKFQQSGTKPTYEIVARTANTSKRNVSTYFKINQTGTVDELINQSGTVENMKSDTVKSGTVENDSLVLNGTVENGTVDEVIIEDNSSSGTVKTGTIESGTVDDDEESYVDKYTTPEERANAVMEYLKDSSKKILTRDILEMNETVDMLFADF